MDASAYYGTGNLLSAKTVKEKALENKQLTIKAVESQSLGRGNSAKDKLVCTFEESEYQLALNATNAKKLMKTWGNETAAWISKKIMLIIVDTDYQGQLVDGIQIRPVVA